MICGETGAGNCLRIELLSLGRSEIVKFAARHTRSRSVKFLYISISGYEYLVFNSKVTQHQSNYKFPTNHNTGILPKWDVCQAASFTSSDRPRDNDHQIYKKRYDIALPNLLPCLPLNIIINRLNTSIPLKQQEE